MFQVYQYFSQEDKNESSLRRDEVQLLIGISYLRIHLRKALFERIPDREVIDLDGTVKDYSFMFLM